MQPGGRIGKYELEEFLGGGMSHVYRARDTVLGRTVAVKILTEAACAQPDAKVRFLAEARLASNLTHDNVLSIYDFGEDQQNRPFMVMEFLRGQNLSNAIRNGETGDTDGKIRTALQVARAIEYIHSQKVIHRDIKPENVHITRAGVAKLMDFGIAKTEGLSMTRTGYVLGTPYYMAPEQVTGKAVTEQADVYAFGVLLFELMTGVKPISGDTVERIFYIILNEPLDLSPLIASGAPPELCDLVARCTAKSPAGRPPGFAPVCAVLEQLAGESSPPVAAPRRTVGVTRRFLAIWASVAFLALSLGVGFGLAWAGYHRLDTQVRATAEAISAAGIASDGLIGAEGLKQFDILREHLDTIDRYHRQGAPLGYRLGSMLWGDLYRPARRLYFDRLRTFFLGPAQNNQLQFLRGLPAAPGPAYSSVYETLKAYLCTTSQPDKSDASFLVPVLLHWWDAGLNPGADRESGASRQIEFYAQELTKDDPFPPDADVAAVTQARRYLDQFPGLERVYAFVMAEAAKRDRPLSFNRRFPESGQVLTESYEVPAQFTRGGWDFVHGAILPGERYLAGEVWVVGDHAAPDVDRSRLAGDLSERYRADFAQAWREYLHGGMLARFTSLKDAAAKLASLAGEKSPLQEWLNLAAQNTAVDDPGIRATFQPVEAALAASRRYRDALAALSTAANRVLGRHATDADTAAVVDRTEQTAKAIEAAFHADSAGHLEVQVSRVLDEPIAGAKHLMLR
ncbi:MAG: ImcF-related family protein [Candidatus Sulfopaludibacter sp.]|nr:ImcF-related family protein [Candidatus Sulfopaludibacter sp.]